MDQRALDDAYDQIVYAPNRDQVLGRYETSSRLALAALGEPRRLAYGPTEHERLDLYLASGQAAPVQIFVHGGGWRGGAASTYAFLAEPFVRAGAHVAILDFAPIDHHDGDPRPMVEQVRRAVRWVYEQSPSFGGDPEQVYLVAHSSGAHLGGCLVTTDWTGIGLPADVLKGALLASGMYDLEPVRLSKRSEYVRFTDEIEEELSPRRHLNRLGTPLVLSYGTYETPEFQRQTRDFFTAVRAAGKPVTLLVAEGYNHFEILETLASPYGLLGRAMLAMMGLGHG
jgi:arylformamidase